MHPVVKLVSQRLALGLLLLLAASALIFLGTLMLPGDVAQSILANLPPLKPSQTCGKSSV